MTDATERMREKAKEIIPDAFIARDSGLRLTLENIKRDIEAALLEAHKKGYLEGSNDCHKAFQKSLKSKGAI